MSGKDNVVADALSRTEATEDAKAPHDNHEEAPTFICNEILPGINYQQLAADQVSDLDVQAYRTAITNLKLSDVPFSEGAFSLLCAVSTGSSRPIIFDTIQALAHPGAKTTKCLVAAKFVWHGLNKQVTHWAKTCLNCQRSKIQTHVKTPLQPFAPVSGRFDHVHIDLVGLLPESQGFK